MSKPKASEPDNRASRTAGRPPKAAARSVVDEYFDRLLAHDWDGLAATLAPDVVRVGPFGDTYSGRDAYVAFIAGLMPRLPGYSMERSRSIDAGDAVTVELTEVVEVGGAPIRTPEALVFDLDGDGLIARITIYTQHLGQEVPDLAR